MITYPPFKMAVTLNATHCKQWVGNGIFWFSLLIIQLAYTYANNMGQFPQDFLVVPFNHNAVHYYNFLLCNILLIMTLFININSYNTIKQMVTGPLKFIERILIYILIFLSSLMQMWFAYILGTSGVVTYYFLITGLGNGYMLYTLLSAALRDIFFSKV